MTPSELAKVREALIYHEHDSDCPHHPALNVGRSCECDSPTINARITEALSILDREAGRKTRTTYRIEHRATYESEWHKQKGRYAKRERAEKCATYYDGPTRIIEVTESWEEPQS